MPNQLSDEDQLFIGAVFYAKLDAHEKGFGKNHPGQSTIECLRCEALGTEGTITYSVAPNGHTAGKCSTPQCVRWLE
jgi:hypothetical protein